MELKRGDLSLLNDPVAQELLGSAIPARLAYVWSDGTPRVIPIWFHWTGEDLVLVSPPRAPKVEALGRRADVCLTIDTEAWPAKVLSIRGTAVSEVVEGEAPEYVDLTRKYLGDAAEGWREQYRRMFPRVARISVRPQWVAIVDVAANRFPRDVASAFAAVSSAQA